MAEDDSNTSSWQSMETSDWCRGRSYRSKLQRVKHIDPNEKFQSAIDNDLDRMERHLRFEWRDTYDFKDTNCMHLLYLRTQAEYDEISALFEITKQIEGHTICALGDAAAWPVQGLIRHFRPQMIERIDAYKKEYRIKHGLGEDEQPDEEYQKWLNEPRIREMHPELAFDWWFKPRVPESAKQYLQKQHKKNPQSADYY
eukprot:27171_1